MHDGAHCGRVGPSESTKIHNKSGNKGKSYPLSVDQSKYYCCENTHKVFQCTKFRDLDLDARRDFVNHRKAFFNCLQQDDVSNQCQSKSKCKTCGATHNKLLHKEEPENEVRTAQANNVHALVNHTYQNRQVLLQTAMIDILNSSGKPFKCRALLHSASQLNPITNQCRKNYGFQWRKQRATSL